MTGWLIICLALAALLTLNVIASLAAIAFWFALRLRAKTWPVTARAGLLFALRLFPMLSALTVVLTLFIPSYLAYEPRPADEVINLKIAVMAIVAGFGLALMAWRALALWRATQRLTADWLSHAERVTIDGLSIPAFRFAHPFPVLAVVGVFRPRLFIADGVLNALDEDELAAALAHEAAHVAARDHFKLSTMRACRDVFATFPGSRALERAWAAEAEAAADERAARGGTAVALSLAAALIKIARITPEASAAILPVGAYLIGDHSGGVGRRVQRLIELAECENNFAHKFPTGEGARRQRQRAYLGGALLAVGLVAFLPRLLLTVFLLTEQFFLLLR
jgi:Zn-dependent protease with chaperone function